MAETSTEFSNILKDFLDEASGTVQEFSSAAEYVSEKQLHPIVKGKAHSTEKAEHPTKEALEEEIVEIAKQSANPTVKALIRTLKRHFKAVTATEAKEAIEKLTKDGKITPAEESEKEKKEDSVSK